MGRKPKNISGQKVNRLTAVSYEKVGRRIMWTFICDCGGTTICEKSSVLSGHTKSCGCYKKDATSVSSFIHGESYSVKRTTEYRSWEAMKYRCQNENSKRYRNYGGRGIKVCDRWLNSFDNFIVDMGRKPSKDFTLDRIDVNGDYTPENCKWSSPYEQANNTTKNVLIVHKETGIFYNSASLAGKAYNKNPSTILSQLRLNRKSDFIKA